MFKVNMPSPFEGAPIFFKPETESTMTDVKNLASQGLPSGTVVSAGHQLAGRGRFPDRRWISAPGESLIFSVLFQIGDFSAINGAISLRAGLAAAAALEKELNLKPEIKWPNDIYLRGRKAAGILVENRGEHLFIGMGINCGSKSYPRELKKTAVSLAEASGRKFPPEELLLPVLKELKIWLFPADNGGKEEIEKRLYLKGKEVTFLPGVSDGTGAVAGQIVGISEDGSLLIKSGASAEPRAFVSGEIRYTPPRKSFFAKADL
jgi:BirA family biotin operon repressor/biotin-[acetyl-CoA-carboxylase] ligase